MHLNLLFSHCKPYNNQFKKYFFKKKPPNYPNKMKKFLTKFLPSTITRFCERITRLIRPVSPLSLPLIIITCNNQAQASVPAPKKKSYYVKEKANSWKLIRKFCFSLTLSPLTIFQCLMSFWAAFQPISN